MNKWIIQGNDPIIDFDEMYYCDSTSYTVEIGLAMTYRMRFVALLKCRTLNKLDPTVGFRVRRLSAKEAETISKP